MAELTEGRRVLRVGWQEDETQDLSAVDARIALENGQMAPVPFVRFEKQNGSQVVTVLLNVAHIEWLELARPEDVVPY